MRNLVIFNCLAAVLVFAWAGFTPNTVSASSAALIGGCADYNCWDIYAVNCKEIHSTCCDNYDLYYCDSDIFEDWGYCINTSTHPCWGDSACRAETNQDCDPYQP